MSCAQVVYRSIGAGLSFDGLIAPMPKEEFLKTYWQQRPCHVSGTPEKFAGLLSWNELNSVLEMCHVEYPRLRMSKFGVDLAAKEYLQVMPFTRVSRINPNGMCKQFADGATLILQHADEFLPSLQSVADALRAGLGWPAEVEIIAGHGTSNGLPVHYDANDCMALQITGSKRWHFYKPTREAPLRRSKLFPRRYDVLPANAPCTTAPYLSIEAQPGGFVYVPRGWWHLVEPNPGPCLSLNPTVYAPTIQDLLQWLIEEMSIEEACRRHIPLEKAEQAELLARMAASLSAKLTPATIREYAAYFQGEMETPLEIHLPDAAVDKAGVGDDAFMRLAGGRPVHFSHDGVAPQFRVRWQGKDIFFNREHLPVFAPLADGRAHSVASLLDDCPTEEIKTGHRKFLAQLMDKRILVTIPSDSLQDSDKELYGNGNETQIFTAVGGIRDHGVDTRAGK